MNSLVTLSLLRAKAPCTFSRFLFPSRGCSFYLRIRDVITARGLVCQLVPWISHSNLGVYCCYTETIFCVLKNDILKVCGIGVLAEEVRQASVKGTRSFSHLQSKWCVEWRSCGNTGSMPIPLLMKECSLQFIILCFPYFKLSQKIEVSPSENILQRVIQPHIPSVRQVRFISSVLKMLKLRCRGLKWHGPRSHNKSVSRGRNKTRLLSCLL